MQVQFYPQRLFADENYAVVVLNRPIKLEAEFFLKIWNKARIRHLVDGGANHFFDLLDTLPQDVKDGVKFPELASGDFDSITEASKRRLQESKETKVIETADQDNTDFTKALDELRKHLASTGMSVNRVAVICENSGRLDQIIGNINTLHKNVFLKDTSASSKVQVFLMNAESLSWLLPARHTSSIHFEKSVPNITCGLIPFQGPSTYRSTGFKWDLTPDMVCSFGGLVSTSNVVVSETLQVTLCDDNHSVFCIEMGPEHYIM